MSLCDKVVRGVFGAEDLSMQYILTTVQLCLSIRVFNILMTYVFLG